MQEVLKKVWDCKLYNELELLLISYFENEKLGSLILTKKNKQSSFYEEELALGFEEETFFYDFLTQDKTYLKNYLKSKLPILVSGLDQVLFFGKESNGLFIRIFKEFPMGFLFIESKLEFKDEQILVLQSFANQLADLYSMEFKNTSSYLDEDIFDLLLESSTGLHNSIQANKFLFIQGSEGTGKKLLVKKIYNELGLKGEIFYEYSLPESEKKIYESIERSIQVSKTGIFVFVDIEKTNKLQQEIFHTFLVKEGMEPKFIFLSSSFKFKEESKIFWELVRSHSIILPDLVEISFSKLKKIIDLIVREESLKQKIIVSKIEDQVYENLFHRKYKRNLIELIELIRSSIANSNDGILKLENLPKQKTEVKEILENDDLDLRKATEKLERELILIALKKYQNNQVRMAKALGISRGSLQYKMKQLEIGNELGR